MGVCVGGGIVVVGGRVGLCGVIVFCVVVWGGGEGGVGWHVSVGGAGVGLGGLGVAGVGCGGCRSFWLRMQGGRRGVEEV